MTRSLVLAVLLAACAPGAVAPAPSASAARAADATSTPVFTASTPTPQPSGTATSSPGLLPIVDAHLHYSREAWGPYPPARVAALMDAAGVRGAFVSSAPDAGTIELRAALGERIVPLLGPYRGPSDVPAWTRDPTVIPYLDSHVRPGVHKGFGEFHLARGQVALPTVQAALRFARRSGLFLHVHTDPNALEELLSDPSVGADSDVVWAHAGVTATTDQVEAQLARWPKLSVELSLRDDIAPKGELDPRWRALFLRYPDRFMVGTDTWVVGGAFTGNERWDVYADIVRGIRGWLTQLPPEVAERIAHLNGERFAALIR